jgi:hypothetical protein
MLPLGHHPPHHHRRAHHVSKSRMGVKCLVALSCSGLLALQAIILIALEQSSQHSITIITTRGLSSSLNQASGSSTTTDCSRKQLALVEGLLLQMPKDNGDDDNNLNASNKKRANKTKIKEGQATTTLTPRNTKKEAVVTIPDKSRTIALVHIGKGK